MTDETEYDGGEAETDETPGPPEFPVAGDELTDDEPEGDGDPDEPDTTGPIEVKL